MPTNYVSQLQQAADKFIETLNNYETIERINIEEDSLEDEDGNWGSGDWDESVQPVESMDASGEAFTSSENLPVPLLSRRDRNEKMTTTLWQISNQSETLLKLLGDNENHIFEISSDQINNINLKIKELSSGIKKFTEATRIDESQDLINNQGVMELFDNLNNRCSEVCQNLALLKRVMNRYSTDISEESVSPMEVDSSETGIHDPNSNVDNQPIHVASAAASSKAEAIESISNGQRICNSIEKMATGEILQTDSIDCNEEVYLKLSEFHLLYRQAQILALIQRLINEITYFERKKVSHRNLSDKLKSFDEKVKAQCGEKYSRETHSAWIRYTTKVKNEEETSELSGCEAINDTILAQGWQESLKSQIATYVGDDESKVDEVTAENIKIMLVNGVTNLVKNIAEITSSQKIMALISFKEWLDKKNYFVKYPDSRRELDKTINHSIDSLTESSSVLSGISSGTNPQRPDSHDMEEAASTSVSAINSQSLNSIVSNSPPDESSTLADSCLTHISEEMKTARDKCVKKVKDGESVAIVGDELKKNFLAIMEDGLTNLHGLNDITSIEKSEAANLVLKRLKGLLWGAEIKFLDENDAFFAEINTLIINFRGSLSEANSLLNSTVDRTGLAEHFSMVMEKVNSLEETINKLVKALMDYNVNHSLQQNLVSELRNGINEYFGSLCHLYGEDLTMGVKEGSSALDKLKKLLQNLTVTLEVEEAISKLVDTLTQGLEEVTAGSDSMDLSSDLSELSPQEQLEHVVALGSDEIQRTIERHIEKCEKISDHNERMSLALAMETALESIKDFMLVGEYVKALSKLTRFIENQKTTTTNVSNSSSSSLRDPCKGKRKRPSSEINDENPQKKRSPSPRLFSQNMSHPANTETASEVKPMGKRGNEASENTAVFDLNRK